ncbi:hypothetical protein [Bradyrhizobium sp. Leo121]|uniref:hypothetical protein n=1 Tax=Bradyrhizobium sp. Leo121 TaxID=1571195 RepID=UPI0010295FF2|nr:hypothetical protein [Bradyrhizobium sp. Leo121]
MNPTAFRRGDLMEHEFSIKGITHYELWMEENASADGSQSSVTQLYYWDFFENVLIVDGYNVFAQENAMMGITTDLTGQAEAG